MLEITFIFAILNKCIIFFINVCFYIKIIFHPSRDQSSHQVLSVNFETTFDFLNIFKEKDVINIIITIGIGLYNIASISSIYAATKHCAMIFFKFCIKQKKLCQKENKKKTNHF